jgi:hypothetical protein
VWSFQRNPAAHVVVFATLWALAVAPASEVAADLREIDLAGPWAFRLDPADVGLGERWFEQTLSERLKLPGSLQEQGFGNDPAVDTKWTGDIVDRSYFESPRYAKYRQPGNIKVPFWLQPIKHYVGAAWYQRTVDVPADWRGKRIVLELERCHWQTTVWVNKAKVGSCDSLAVPHVYDLTEYIEPGPNRLTIRVDNRMIVNVGPNSHSVADHTQSNWNGIVGRLALAATDPLWIDDVQVSPDVAGKRAVVRVVVGNRTGQPSQAKLVLAAEAQNAATPHKPQAQRVEISLAAQAQTAVEVVYPLGDDAQPWDEFRPALYRLDVALQSGPPTSCADRRTVVFGMRHLTTRGTQFVLNGRPIYVRGTLECCIFPWTGYPPTDVASWKRVIAVCKAHGLNLLRFHSHCPPEAAFIAADEMGFYLHVECPSWANQGASLGNGDPLDQWLYLEADRMLRAYGNHPSFMFMPYGNEPAGPGNGAKYLAQWVEHYKKKDPRRLYTSGAGWPLIPQSQFHVAPEPRIQGWGQGLKSPINALPPETTTDYRDYVRRFEVPVISHEIGQWCVYPNFDEMAKYTGVLKPRNFEIFRDFLVEAGLAHQARDFLMASGKLQTLCYKEEIESALRTPGFGGFELLDLHDFPGQGSALVGVLDPFWDSKPYVGPAEYRRFCGATVPLARMTKRVFTSDETFSARVEVSHFGPADLVNPVVAWKLQAADGKVVASGEFSREKIPTGQLTEVGRIEASLRAAGAPQKLRLVVGIAGTEFENDWDLWVYPASVPADPPEGIHIVRQLDEALAALDAGGKVLLLAPPRSVKTDVALGFSSIFWNTAWTHGQAPHTLGILCDPKHPALEAFPTEYHSNWQWWDLVHGGAAMVLDGLPKDVHPLVQVVPDWFQPKRLAMAFEARVGRGRLLVASMDLANDLPRRPVARQMRHSLLRYMAGKRFDPKPALSIEQVRSLFKTPTVLERLGATIRADSQQPGYEADRAIDGDPATIWHTAWEPEPKAHPHHLILDLKVPVKLAGLVYVPRQDMANGRIGRWAIYASDDPARWGEPVATGQWADGTKPQTVRFAKPLAARFVKIEALSEVKGRPFASAAEIDVLAE